MNKHLKKEKQTKKQKQTSELEHFDPSLKLVATDTSEYVIGVVLLHKGLEKKNTLITQVSILLPVERNYSKVEKHCQ